MAKDLLTSSALPTNTYTAGTVGVSSDNITMTSNGQLSVDGIAVSVGDTIYVNNESAQSHNGVYNVAVAGDVSTQASLNRNSNGEFAGDLEFTVGSANTFSRWACNQSPPVNQGVSNGSPVSFIRQFSTAPAGLLSGFKLSNNSGSPNTKLDIDAGGTSDSLALTFINGPGQTKDISAAWASGTGNGGVFSGSVAASTVYHVFAIKKDTDFTVDFGFDTSVSATNRPSGYTYFRRLGSVITDASSHILAFHQHGDEFWLDTPIKDVDVTNPGTSAVSRMLTVPTGVQVAAIVNAICWDGNADVVQYISSLESVDVAPSYANAVESAPSDHTGEGVSQNRVWTNTSAQVRTRLSYSGAGTAFKMLTLGWVDTRGK